MTVLPKKPRGWLKNHLSAQDLKQFFGPQPSKSRKSAEKKVLKLKRAYYSASTSPGTTEKTDKGTEQNPDLIKEIPTQSLLTLTPAR